MIPLSEAMEMGTHILKPCLIGGNHARKFGQGCALDMAMVAVGDCRPWQFAHNVWPWLEKWVPWADHDSYDPIANEWGMHLALKFDCAVMGGIRGDQKSMTMAEFIEYVRMVEPKEESEETHELELCTTAG